MTELVSWKIELRNSPRIQEKKKGLDRMKEKSTEMEARARWSNISLTGEPGENEKNGKEDKL